MKKLIITIIIITSVVMEASGYDFQSGNLLYSIISMTPPQVSLDGHIDGQAAQGELVIPETVNYEGVTYTVTKIGLYAFDGCEGLMGQLVIPNTVTEISANAFTSCTGFTGTLVIPNSVTKLCEDFYYTFGAGYGSFQNCTGFTNLELPETLPIIGDYCFAECTGLTGELVIPEGVTEIWQHAFWHCSNLTSVRFPNSLTVIGYAAFENCQGLIGALEIPLSVTEIYGRAFSYCSNISSITLCSGIQLKGDYVFSYCSSLSRIEIPEGWEKTSKNTFEGCSNLREACLPESLKSIETGCFNKCINLSEVNLHEGITSIGNKAFSHCISLSGDLIIPNSVETIYPYAFDSCYNINRVVLGRSINHFSEDSFRNILLDRFVIKAMTPPLMEYDIWQFSRDLSIIVPCGTLEAYQNAGGWSEFTNITEGVMYDFVALSEDEDKGIVIVLKEATCEDMMVEVEAVPMDGSSFYYWEANGEMISFENPYSFTLDNDMRLVAVFSGTGIKELKQSVSIYPNPTREKLTIDGIKSADIQVYNSIGQLLKTMQNTNKTNLEGLPSGIYTIRVILESGNVFSDKVVKE